ncbi:DUF362 domain-containing protein [Anaerospora sp.]|uniref:DUF362 domain-containing protein n=1 Tax=Anaerospora sp. TaxID=1960278 RepID=UPI00289EF3EE|nr:DUF362 domain-containing protein [Anaerospora sp.]
MTKVAAVKADSYDPQIVGQAISDLLAHLGGISQFIQPGERVLVKPNMLEAVEKGLCVTTDPEVVRAVIRAVRQVGAIPVVGDSPGTTSTVKAAEKCGILAVCQEENVELAAFDETTEVAYPDGITLKKFTIARRLAEVDKVISLAKMKTHTFMGATGATKNLFGCIVGMQKAQFHLRMQARQEFAAMLIDLASCVKPVLAIIDGVMGMEGNGPRNGNPIKAGVILGGANCFAVDVVMAEMMGFKPEQLPVTALALKRNLTPAFSAIELVGSGGQLRWKFVEPRSLQSLEDRIPKWLAAFGRSQLTARPEITASCVGCGRCVKHCPPQAMAIVSGQAAIDYTKCIRCYCCQELCPYDAVQLHDGLLLQMAKQITRLR